MLFSPSTTWEVYMAFFNFIHSSTIWIMDITLIIIIHILLLKGNYVTKAELKEWQPSAKGMMLISSRITDGSWAKTCALIVRLFSSMSLQKWFLAQIGVLVQASLRPRFLFSIAIKIHFMIVQRGMFLFPFFPHKRMCQHWFSHPALFRHFLSFFYP